MSRWLFGGLTLALGSALLAGCAVAPGEAEERVASAQSELGERSADAASDASGTGHSDATTSGASAHAEGVEGDDGHQPDPLPWRGEVATAHVSGGDPERTSNAGQDEEPDPLPWKPHRQLVGVETETPSDADKTK